MTAITQDDHLSQLELGPPVLKRSKFSLNIFCAKVNFHGSIENPRNSRELYPAKIHAAGQVPLGERCKLSMYLNGYL